MALVNHTLIDGKHYGWQMLTVTESLCEHCEHERTCEQSRPHDDKFGPRLFCCTWQTKQMPEVSA